MSVLLLRETIEALYTGSKSVFRISTLINLLGVTEYYIPCNPVMACPLPTTPCSRSVCFNCCRFYL